MYRTPRLALLVSFICFALAACGNKGPLVLPDKTAEQQQQDKDKDKKKDQPANAAQPAAKSGDAANQH